MTPHERRSRIVTRSNPDTHHDYIVEIEGQIALPGPPSGTASVALRYVPDRLILDPSSLGEYLSTLEKLSFNTPESIAAVVLDDLNNELVMRWIQVCVTMQGTAHPGVTSHGVMLEDRQPGWNNALLLSRLRPF